MIPSCVRAGVSVASVPAITGFVAFGVEVSINVSVLTVTVMVADKFVVKPVALSVNDVTVVALVVVDLSKERQLQALDR